MRGNNLPIILFPPDTRARAFHDSLLDFTRTKNAFEASASNSFERKGTRRDFVFFSRGAFWSHHLLPDLSTRVSISLVGTRLFSRRGDKKKRNEDVRSYVLAFPIRSLRKRKRKHTTTRRREGNQRASPPTSRATKGTSRVFRRRAFVRSFVRRKVVELVAFVKLDFVEKRDTL